MAHITKKPSTTDSSQTINPAGMLGDHSNQNSGRLMFLELDVLKSPICLQYENDNPLTILLRILCPQIYFLD